MSETSAIFRVTRQSTEELTASEVDVGTSAACVVHLDDPIAAARHLVVAFASGEFRVRALKTSTGTYRNGLPITPSDGDTLLAHGDELVVGVTRIGVVLDEARPSAIELVVKERSFFFTAKKREEFDSDADAWVFAEVGFGRFPALRKANAIALGLVVLMLPVLWFFDGGRRVLQPGALTSVHAAALEQGCEACHDSFASTPAAKCAVCHADKVDPKLHPFDAGGLECAACHSEHHGARPAPGTTKPKDAASACTDCHAHPTRPTREAVAAAIGARSLPADTPRALGDLAPRGFETFSHALHTGAGLACDRCHVPGGEDPTTGRRLFARPTFESCMQCHDANAEPSDRSGSWSVALEWHGSGEDGRNCETCHEQAFEPALRRVSVVRPAELTHTLRIRSHASEMGLVIDGERCSDCHADAENLLVGEPRARPFRHDVHLSTVAPRSDAAATELSRSECASCHTEIETHASLSEEEPFYAGPPVESCAECHTGGDVRRGETSVPLPEPETVVAFDHSRHGIEVIAGGCFACHVLDEPSADVSTLPAAADCTACHVTPSGDAHVAIGGGDCSTCHPPVNGRMSSVFNRREEPAERSVKFDHFTESHGSADCLDCHADVPGSSSVAEILRMEGTAHTVCRACHAQSRFHWQ